MSLAGEPVDSLYGSVGSLSSSTTTSTSSQPGGTSRSSLTTSFSNDFSIGSPDRSHSALDRLSDGDSEQEFPLDQDDGRVVLRMEVSHKEHSFLIGTGGQKVRDIRVACSCLIHFPDVAGVRTLQSLKHDYKQDPIVKPTYPPLLGNEVSVRGKLANVIAGLQEVRSAIPFNLSFVVHTLGCSLAEGQQGIIQLERVFGIEVKTKVAEKGSGLVVTVRGPQSERTLLGVNAACSFFAPHIAPGLHQVTQIICISPQSQSHMFDLCDAQMWLRKIGELARVHIAFPNPSGNNGDNETVTLTGTIRAVGAAWIIVMSMLPVTLRVYLHRESSYHHLESYITRTLGVSFFPPKKESALVDHPYVELRTIEGNLANLCKAHQHLVQATGPMAPKVRISSTEEKLANLGLSTFKSLVVPPVQPADFAAPAARTPVNSSQRKARYSLINEPLSAPTAYQTRMAAHHPGGLATSYQPADFVAQAAALQFYAQNLRQFPQHAFHQPLTSSAFRRYPNHAELSHLSNSHQWAMPKNPSPVKPESQSTSCRCQCNCTRTDSTELHPAVEPIIRQPFLPPTADVLPQVKSQRETRTLHDFRKTDAERMKTVEPPRSFYADGISPMPTTVKRSFMDSTPYQSSDVSIEELMRGFNPQDFVEELMRAAVDPPPSPGWVHALNMGHFF